MSQKKERRSPRSNEKEAARARRGHTTYNKATRRGIPCTGTSDRRRLRISCRCRLRQACRRDRLSERARRGIHPGKAQKKQTHPDPRFQEE
jgi:hypothetical protein